MPLTVVVAPFAQASTSHSSPVHSGPVGHTFGIPISPQTPPSGHSPQSIVPPQPFPISPQYCPPDSVVHEMGVQFVESPHTFSMPPPPQVFGGAHSPQSSVPPQPSPTSPQNSPPIVSQVSGTQPGPVQLPPVHVCPDGHSPQSSVPPQPAPPS